MSKPTGTQTQTSQTQVPGWVDNSAQVNYGLASTVSANLMKPYEGQRVADLTPDQLKFIQQLSGNVGGANAAYDTASGITNGLAGFNSGQLTPEMMKGMDLSAYMNPYTQSVIDPTMQIMEQSRRQALGQVGDQATQARAFGGSRQGISEGVTNAQSELQKGQFVGGLQSQNFLNAQNMAAGDISRDWTAQVANQQARQSDAAFQSNQAKQLAGLASGKQNDFLTSLQAAMGGQATLQAQNQQQLDAKMALYNEQKQYPLDQLQILQNALAVSPYGKTETVTKPGATDDVLGKILSAGTAGVGMAGSIMSMMAM